MTLWQYALTIFAADALLFGALSLLCWVAPFGDEDHNGFHYQPAPPSAEPVSLKLNREPA